MLPSRYTAHRHLRLKISNSHCAGQGEAQSCAQRQHYCCKRYGTRPLLQQTFLLTRTLAAVADAIRTVRPHDEVRGDVV